MATTTNRIGELCVGADWACAHGDLEALQFVATELATNVVEPLQHDLIALADACLHDPDRAVERWVRFKERFDDRSRWKCLH